MCWRRRTGCRPSRGSCGGGGSSRGPGAGPGGASTTQVLLVNSLRSKIFQSRPLPGCRKIFHLRNFLLCREASRGPTDTVRRAGLACQVMLYLWCKLSSNLGLGVEPVLHHGLLVYDPNLGWDQLCGVAGPRCFTVLLSQT